ncbi:MAG: hypothetical protein ABUS47_01605 [Steroidobacter sp.]
MVANRHCDDAAFARHQGIACLTLLAGLTACAPSGQNSTELQHSTASEQSSSAASASSEVAIASASVTTSSVATGAVSSSVSSVEKTVTPPVSSTSAKTSGNSHKATSSSSQSANAEAHEAASAHETGAETAPPVSSTAPSNATESASSSSSSSTTLSTAPASQPSLDLDSLEQRLRETKAIGVFTKLSLKNQVDDLLSDFRAHYAGKSSVALSDLRQRYDLLLMKILTLLQDDDAPLAADIRSSREAIWDILRDPNKFAQIS